MSKKIKVLNYIQLGLWIITFITLMVLILIPKNEYLLNRLFKIFGILFLVMPLVLSVANIAIFQIAKPVATENFDKMPFVGLCAMSLLSVIYFLSSINMKGKFITIAIILMFVAFNVFFIYKLNKQKYEFKKQAFYLGISLIAYGVFFLLLVYISYNYGVNWVDPYM